MKYAHQCLVTRFGLVAIAALLPLFFGGHSVAVAAKGYSQDAVAAKGYSQDGEDLILHYGNILDKYPPEVSPSRIQGTYSRRFKLGLECTDLLTGCKKFVYTTDGSTPDLNDPSHTYRGPFMLPGPGRVLVKYQAEDNVGNIGPVITKIYEISSRKIEIVQKIQLANDLKAYLPPAKVLLTFGRIINEFNGYDYNGDGLAEIKTVESPEYEDQRNIVPDAKVILILVERQLLERANTSTSSFLSPTPRRLEELLGRIERLNDDLVKEGYTVRTVVMDVHRDPEVHQDGRTVLAIREMFKAVKDRFHNFQGAIMIGEFPEAVVVRRVARKKVKTDRNWYLDPTSGSRITVPEGGNLSVLKFGSSAVYRTNIVLEDLDGDWADTYIEEETTVEGITAVTPRGDTFPNAGTTEFRTTNWRSALQPKIYEDFFFVNDTAFNMSETGPNRVLRINWDQRNPEVSRADKVRGTPQILASPEISVSRISARKIARMPRADLLGDDSMPTELRSTNPDLHKLQNWIQDRGMEINLINLYLDRNHAHRNGRNIAKKTYQRIRYDSSITSLETSLKDNGLEELDFIDDAGLVEYVNFLKGDSLLKGIVAHSSSQSSDFKHVGKRAGAGDGAIASLITGGIGDPSHIFNWQRSHTRRPNYTYTPSVRGAVGDCSGTITACKTPGVDWANYHLYLTLFKKRTLSPPLPFTHTYRAQGHIYLHVGCEVTSPIDGIFMPFSHEQYGRGQNADSILFMANGLAVVGRAKTFNDYPNEFGEELGKGENVGHALRHSSEVDRAKEGISRIDSKRYYFWSVLGDWTLKL